MYIKNYKTYNQMYLKLNDLMLLRQKYRLPSVRPWKMNLNN